jgi:glycosyltransferase involved in cell wall biosynthesis
MNYTYTMIPILLSVVTPAYNEEDSIESLIKKLHELRKSFKEIEIIVVNDGSTDRTAELVKKMSKEIPNLILVNLALNSGHMAAITAGLKKASGDWIATVDADGQDNPNLITKMYEECIKSRADICYTQRINRGQDSFTHKIFSPFFYKFLRKASRGETIYQSADFRIFSRRVLVVLNNLHETNKMYRVLLPSLGFKSTIVEYERESRSAGKSKYNFALLFKLGIKSFLATTGSPLRWVSFLSALSAVIALTVSTIAVIEGLFLNSVPGWASLAFLISVLYLFQAVAFLVFSEFLIILLADVRQRPIYQVDIDDHGID